MTTGMIAHGVNVGHGFTKYLVNLPNGEEQAVVFPSLLAPALQQLTGALAQIDSVEVAGGHWWIGADALLGQHRTALSQDRLTDPVFIPAMVRAALKQLGVNGQPGQAVSGLPASWATDQAKAEALAERLRVAAPDTYRGGKIKIINEPLAVIYAMALDAAGVVVDDETLSRGRVAVVDLGHYTVDVVVVNALRPEPASLATYELGTAEPLSRIRALINGRYELDLSLFQVDQAVRDQRVKVAGHFEALPAGWEQELARNGEQIAARLTEEWKRGSSIDRILIAGGGSELAPLASSIANRFRQAVIVPEGQLAIARGYARFGRRLLESQR